MKGFLRLTSLLFAVAHLASAKADFVALAPQDIPLQIEGQEIVLVARPQVDLQFAEGTAHVPLHATIDGSTLQAAIPAVVNGMAADDECGDRVRVSGASLGPADGRARLEADVHFERFLCTSMHVPVCRNVFDCRMELQRTSRNRILAQSAHVCVDLIPVVRNGNVELGHEVTCARPDGPLGDIVRGLGLEGRLRREAERALRGTFEQINRTLLLPPEFSDYNIAITEIAFTGEDGRLGLRLAATGDVTAEQALELISRAVQ